MPFQQISESVYVRISPERIPSSDSNRGYIICDDFIVEVDTTYFLDNLRRDLDELRKITNRKVGYVINTHYHPDHAYGNFLFRCPIIAQYSHAKVQDSAEKRRARWDYPNNRFQSLPDQ